MKIAIAADHAGYPLKELLRAHLEQEGHQVVDGGTTSTDSTDYPDYAEFVGRRVANGDAERGILVCSTGVGMSIAANKIPGVRAALALNEDEVALTRAHNDANVLTIGGRYFDGQSGGRLVDIFLNTAFSGGERHERRLEKVAALEAAPSQAGEN